MQTNSTKQFGLIIAYVIPGFVALAGVAPLFPAVSLWLHPVATGEFGLGPPLYTLLGALALGLLLSCFRWLILDSIHAHSGITRPTWNDRQLAGVLDGFDYLVQSHYRYYEFTGNTLLALAITYALNRLFGTLSFLGIGTDLGMVIVLAVLFAASRDALAKYYARTSLLVGHAAEKAPVGENMFNGNDHGGAADKPKPPTKPEERPKDSTASERPAAVSEKPTN